MCAVSDIFACKRKANEKRKEKKTNIDNKAEKNGLF